MEFSEERIKELQKILEKETGKEISYQDAEESARNLWNLFEFVMRWEEKDRRLKKRLEQDPAGFHLEDGTYSCCICRAYISGEQAWYDHGGIKCPICQKAFDSQIISISACKNRDSWYSIGDLRSYYNVHWATARKLVKQGKLKARIVLDNAGKPYFYLFLIAENASVLGPKPEG